MTRCNYCFEIDPKEGTECEESPTRLHSPRAYHLPGEHEQQKHAGDDVGGGVADHTKAIDLLKANGWNIDARNSAAFRGGSFGWATGRAKTGGNPNPTNNYFELTSSYVAGRMKVSAEGGKIVSWHHVGTDGRVLAKGTSLKSLDDYMKE